MDKNTQKSKFSHFSEEYNFKGKANAFTGFVDVLTSPVFVPIKNIAIGFRDVFCSVSIWNPMYLTDNTQRNFYRYCNQKAWDLGDGYVEHKNYERFYRFLGAVVGFIPAFLISFPVMAGLGIKNALEPGIKILKNKEKTK